MTPDIKSLSSHPSVGEAALSYVEFRNPIARRTPLASVFAGMEADCCEFDEACFCDEAGRNRAGCVFDLSPILPDGPNTNRTLAALHPDLTFGEDRPSLRRLIFGYVATAFVFVGTVAALYGALYIALDELTRFAPGAGL